MSNIPFGQVGILQIGSERYGFRPMEIYTEYGHAPIMRGEFMPDVFEASNLRVKAVEYLNNNFGKRAVPQIKNVIFNNPATVVMREDGTKTVVKCQPGDTYSKETGLALCIAKKYLGNKGNFNEVFKKWIPEETEPVEEFPFYEMWGRLREEIEMGVEEGRAYGYDDPKSENFGKFYVYERILKKMNALEAYRKEK